MRLAPVILAGALSATVASAIDPLIAQAVAQVTTDPSALDALRKPSPPARRHHVPRRRAPARHPAEAAPETAKPETAKAETAKPGATKPETAKPEATKPRIAEPPAKPPAEPPRPAQPGKPAVPAIPPAILALPPPIQVPTAHPPPLPTAPVANDAPGDATAIPGGVRITFGEGRADLNPATEAVIRDFGQSQVAKPDQPITVYAYAAGSREDPSTPRRLSLERALAARAVLIHAGIPSPRIYPRALGATGGTGEPDRVDVVAGAPAPTEPDAPTPQPAVPPEPRP